MPILLTLVTFAPQLKTRNSKLKTHMSDPTQSYCLAHTSDLGPLLLALERDTHLRTLSPQMLSGPYQGALLRFISLMIRPRHILEIGTFTGYAALCLAEGLADDGVLHTIEVNDELAWIIRQYIDRAGLNEKIRLYLGDAASVIPTIDAKFDLVFMDAGKMDYAHHYELALAKMQAGGFLLADNVLWDGKVLHDAKDATAQALRDFNDFVQNDPRVENMLLHLRDGLMVVRKK